MKPRFEIQGRLIERRDGVRIRDEVRRASAQSHEEAVRLAIALRADGFTVWIYRVEAGSGSEPVYRSVGMFEPQAGASGPSSTPGSGRETP